MVVMVYFTYIVQLLVIAAICIKQVGAGLVQHVFSKVAFCLTVFIIRIQFHIQLYQNNSSLLPRGKADILLFPSFCWLQHAWPFPWLI